MDKQKQKEILETYKISIKARLIAMHELHKRYDHKYMEPMTLIKGITHTQLKRIYKELKKEENIEVKTC